MLSGWNRISRRYTRCDHTFSQQNVFDHQSFKSVIKSESCLAKWVTGNKLELDPAVAGGDWSAWPFMHTSLSLLLSEELVSLCFFFHANKTFLFPNISVFMSHIWVWDYFKFKTSVLEFIMLFDLIFLKNVTISNWSIISDVTISSATKS